MRVLRLFMSNETLHYQKTLATISITPFSPKLNKAIKVLGAILWDSFPSYMHQFH